MGKTRINSSDQSRHKPAIFQRSPDLEPKMSSRILANRKSAIDEFRVLFHQIAELSVNEELISVQNICDHMNAVGMVKISDGSLQDFQKAMNHIINLIGETLKTPNRFNETEFVTLWLNLHIYFNKFDTNNSGSITKAEFLNSMKGKTTELDTEDKVTEIFDLADRNNDGSIDFIEFFAKLPQLLKLT